MAASASFTTDPRQFAQQYPNAQVFEDRVGPGTYTITGAAQYGVSNLGADGGVAVDGVLLPALWHYATHPLQPGQVFEDATVVVTGSEGAVLSWTVFP